MKRIIIMGSHDANYAWDAQGRAIALNRFIHGNAGSLGRELETWSRHIREADGAREQFPWKDYNHWGMTLAERLKDLLGPDTEIVYRKHRMDITREEWREIKIGGTARPPVSPQTSAHPE